MKISGAENKHGNGVDDEFAEAAAIIIIYKTVTIFTARQHSLLCRALYLL